jgi:hypothetical protein
MRQTDARYFPVARNCAGDSFSEEQTIASPGGGDFRLATCASRVGPLLEKNAIPRAYKRILKVARTYADLDGGSPIEAR